VNDTAPSGRRCGEDVEAGETAVIRFTPRSAVALRSTCDKKLSFLRSHREKGMEGRHKVRYLPGRGMYLQPGSGIERPLATGGRRPASFRMVSATRSGGIPILSPEYCTCISVATRPGQSP
jgi:hypothetical protein